MDDRARRVSRRRVLAAAAGGAAAAVAVSPLRRLAAQTTPEASPPAPVAAASPAASPVAAPLPMPSTLAAGASPEFRGVAETLVAAMRQFQVPGAALGILAGDREEHATFGLASLSSTLPVSPDTLFQIGSLTKTFTATAIWRLIDEGALALDAPVRTYLPDFKLADEATAAKATVANLLDHTGGWWGDNFTDTGAGDDAVARYVAEVFPTLPQLSPLGNYFSYNNAGFVLLGRLLEVATGTTYDAALRSLLLAPLGLDGSFLDHAEVLRRPYADGHVAGPINGHDAVAVQTPLFIPRMANPAGGVWSTTRDLVRYARFHLGSATGSAVGSVAGDGAVAGAARIVQPASLRRMQEPAIDVPASTIRMGMDWFVQEVDGVRAIMHGGDTLGHHTEFVVVPERRFAFVLLTNNDGGGTLAAQAALTDALARYPGLAPLSGKIGLTLSLLVPPDAPQVTVPPEKLADYVGRFATPTQAAVVEVKDGRLWVTPETFNLPNQWTPAIQPPPTPPTPVTFVAEDVANVGGFAVPFVRDRAGRVQWILYGARLIPRREAGGTPAATPGP